MLGEHRSLVNITLTFIRIPQVLCNFYKKKKTGRIDNAPCTDNTPQSTDRFRCSADTIADNCLGDPSHFHKQTGLEFDRHSVCLRHESPLKHERPEPGGPSRAQASITLRTITPRRPWQRLRGLALRSPDDAVLSRVTPSTLFVFRLLCTILFLFSLPLISLCKKDILIIN